MQFVYGSGSLPFSQRSPCHPASQSQIATLPLSVQLPPWRQVQFAHLAFCISGDQKYNKVRYSHINNMYHHILLPQKKMCLVSFCWLNLFFEQFLPLSVQNMKVWTFKSRINIIFKTKFQDFSSVDTKTWTLLGFF